MLFTALLYIAQPGTLWFAIVCVIASNFFFGSGENLLAAFLPEIAKVRAVLIRLSPEPTTGSLLSICADLGRPW